MKLIQSKSSLAVALSKLAVFTKAKVSEEQYPTDSEIAGDMLWTAHMQGDIDGVSVADLGSGTGILGIGALLLGASKVYFVERDIEAMQIARENLEKIKSEYKVVGEAVFAEQDVLTFNEQVNTVIENPPFGTKQKHADKKFLERAILIGEIVYTLHKSSTAKFIQAFVDDNNWKITGRLDFLFALKQTMKFHSKKIKRIEVSMFRLRKK